MVIGFIGAGRTGCTLGKYLEGYVTVAGYYSRTWQSADDAATFTQSRAFCDLETLVNSCDTIFITTPDGVISEVWECIRHYNLKDKIVILVVHYHLVFFQTLAVRVHPAVQYILCMHSAVNINPIYNLIQRVCLLKDRKKQYRK